MVPLLEDRPRRPIDDVKEMMHVQLPIPFGRTKKIVMAEGVVHPIDYVLEIFQGRIPDNYVIVTPTWIHLDHKEYEIDLHHVQPIGILEAAKCEEILWMKDDIEIMPAMPTPMPTSVVGSCPSEGDDLGDDDNDNEGKGGDDKGKKSSPPGKSPPPPSKSLPPGPTNEARGSGAAPGGKTTPAS
jgi:hypothetical protein